MATCNELEQVKKWFEAQEGYVEKFQSLVRSALDEVIDTPRTSRVSLDECEQTEKTYLGTKIEILVRNAFSLENGEEMDYKVEGLEVDCKWSTSDFGWNFPKEARGGKGLPKGANLPRCGGRICLLVHANESASAHRSVMKVGLILAHEKYMRKGKNQDEKKTLLKKYRNRIHYLNNLRVGTPLPPNFLLHLAETDRKKILDERAGGTERVARLLKHCEGVILKRHTIESVGQQLDPAKRVRDARNHHLLAGYTVLNGHWSAHRQEADRLGGPVPKDADEWVCLRTVIPCGETSRSLAKKNLPALLVGQD